MFRLRYEGRCLLIGEKKSTKPQDHLASSSDELATLRCMPYPALSSLHYSLQTFRMVPDSDQQLWVSNVPWGNGVVCPLCQCDRDTIGGMMIQLARGNDLRALGIRTKEGMNITAFLDHLEEFEKCRRDQVALIEELNQAIGGEVED
jgi:hypothetical protein